MKFSRLRCAISRDHVTPWPEVTIPTWCSKQSVKLLATSANFGKERQNHWRSVVAYFWVEISRHDKEMERAVRAILLSVAKTHFVYNRSFGNRNCFIQSISRDWFGGKYWESNSTVFIFSSVASKGIVINVISNAFRFYYCGTANHALVSWNM